MAEYQFQLKAKWNGGRLGEGTISSGNLQTSISVPSELDGPGVGTNPEELLLGAASTCYLITLAAVLENRKIEVINLTMESEGVLSSEGGLHFVSITHKPSIELASTTSAEQVEVVHKAVQRAEQACMISKALKGNVEVSVVPDVKL